MRKPSHLIEGEQGAWSRVESRKPFQKARVPARMKPALPTTGSNGSPGRFSPRIFGKELFNGSSRCTGRWRRVGGGAAGHAGDRQAERGNAGARP